MATRVAHRQKAIVKPGGSTVVPLSSIDDSEDEVELANAFAGQIPQSNGIPAIDIPSASEDELSDDDDDESTNSLMQDALEELGDESLHESGKYSETLIFYVRNMLKID